MSKLLSLKNILRFDSFKSIQNISKQRISYLLTKLNDRKVIGIKGNDSYDYIQGLVTNDLKHLCATRETTASHNCIHSFVLNTSGRVITDVFIYKFDFNSNDTKQLFIDIDSQLLDSMNKFLNSYRIRRKVMIEIQNEFEVWALFPSVDQINEQVFQQMSENDSTFESLNSEELFAVTDPRLKEIGFRLLVRKLENSDEIETKEKIKTFLNKKSIEFNETNADNYHKFRYRLGVGEGVKDFPIETCFPLECNGDLLNGISFLKGCYVGQELTARIYHTGVIRKRLMPIKLMDANKVIESISVQNIRTTDGKNVGKFRSNSGVYGLALLRVEDCLKANELVLSDSEISVKCHKPFWWPKESIKQSVPCGRADH